MNLTVRGMKVDEVLSGLPVIRIKQMSLSDFASLEGKMIVDAKGLKPDELQEFLLALKRKTGFVYGLHLNGINLESNQDYLSPVVISMKELGNLSELDLSNNIFAPAALSELCSYMNVVQSGFCPIQRLILSRCRYVKKLML